MRCLGRDAAVRFAFMMSLPITVGALVRPPSALRVGAATRLGTWFLSEHTNGVALGDVWRSGGSRQAVRDFGGRAGQPDGRLGDSEHSGEQQDDRGDEGGELAACLNHATRIAH